MKRFDASTVQQQNTAKKKKEVEKEYQCGSRTGKRGIPVSKLPILPRRGPKKGNGEKQKAKRPFNLEGAFHRCIPAAEHRKRLLHAEHPVTPLILNVDTATSQRLSTKKNA